MGTNQIMIYDFDKLTDRFNSQSYKWCVSENELPMWVADMDFETAPEIREALLERVNHGIFGYNTVPDEWYQAYISWWKHRHNVEFKKEWLLFCTGVVPAISSMVRKLTTPAENVLIQTPVYNIFFNSILNNGRKVIENPLVYENGEYHIDFDDLEIKLSDSQTTLMILCNPHNPVGKIWSKEELERIGELCSKHHVTVISDEIHCDITDPDFSYVPFSSVSETCARISATCIAPTKTFSIPGIQTSAIVVSDSYLRHKIWRGINTDEVAEPNNFATVAAVAAFTKGEPWLEELRLYISENKKVVNNFISENLPVVKIIPSHATYLLWLDCSNITDDAGELTKYIRKTTGLYLTKGEEYGTPGKQFIRMNIACPRTRLQDGLERLLKGISSYETFVLPSSRTDSLER